MSNIPPLYEGTPLRSDNWIMTFVPVGSISVGNIVTPTSGTNMGVQVASSNSAFFLGIALTTGGLAGGAQSGFGAQGPTPMAIITRGFIDVIVDGTANVGDYLVPSAASAGYAHSLGGIPTSSSNFQLRAVALVGTTTSGSTIQAFLY